jgi:hypothetical protein
MRAAHARVRMRCIAGRHYRTRGMCIGNASTRFRVRPVAAAGSKIGGDTAAIVPEIGSDTAASVSEITNAAVLSLAAFSTTGERRGIKARRSEVRTGGQNGFE